MKILKFLLICITAISLNNKAFATVSFSIQGGEIPKTKILFFGFDSTNPNLKNDSFEILNRIKKNLKTTDLFDFVSNSEPIEISVASNVVSASLNENLAQDNLTVESIPNFEKYTKVGIGAILIGQFSYDVSGNLEIRVRMWDVLDRRQLFGKFYTSSKDNFRKVSNIISNEIFKAITQESLGHFNSRILYTSESGNAKHRIKKINIMDFDGENHQVLTDGRDLVLTPTFSRRQNEIFYLRYFQNVPQIFSLNLENLRIKKVGGFRGTTLGASSSPINNNLILLASTIDGNSDIYELDISDNSAKRLTKSPAIDTTPSYSPNGKLIAFSSDRDSGQQIYITDPEGNSTKRVSSDSATYSKPVWSPDGKLIAFTKIKGGQFFIGIMAPNGSGEKMLASGYLVEGAKWAPNGRYLVFSKKKSAYGDGSIPRLYIVDIITGFEYELPTPTGEGASDPDWGM